MNIGDRIRIRREELGMSQDELARAAGYKSRSSINKIEVDGRGLPQSKIVAIANALHVTPSFLMGWEDENGDAIVETETLSAIEEEYVRKMRMLPEKRRELIISILNNFIEELKEG